MVVAEGRSYLACWVPDLVPVFSKWPNSIADKLATVLFGVTMLPLMLGYGVGVLGDWIRLVGWVCGFVKGSRHRR
jgi:hypothetical protein